MIRTFREIIRIINEKLEVGVVGNVASESGRGSKRRDGPEIRYTLYVHVGPWEFECAFFVLVDHSPRHPPFLFEDGLGD